MKAIVLAAGHGKRMKGYATDTPKVMLPLSDGRSIIEHVIDRLIVYGFEPVIAVSKSGYGDKIIEHLEHIRHYNGRIIFSSVENPSGTAGEVYSARALLRDEKSFLIYYGDIVANVDLDAMRKKHDREQNVITLCGRSTMESSEGLMRMHGDTVEFEEKPRIDIRKLGWDAANCPIFFIERDVMEYIERMKPEHETDLDFSNHVFPALSADKKRMGIYVHDGFYYNVGDGKIAETVRTLQLDF